MQALAKCHFLPIFLISFIFILRVALSAKIRKVKIQDNVQGKVLLRSVDLFAVCMCSINQRNPIKMQQHDVQCDGFDSYPIMLRIRDYNYARTDTEHVL